MLRADWAVPDWAQLSRDYLLARNLSPLPEPQLLAHPYAFLTKFLALRAYLYD